MHACRMGRSLLDPILPLAIILLALAGCGDAPPPKADPKAAEPPTPIADAKVTPTAVSAPVPKPDPDKELAARVKKALEDGARESAPGIDVSAAGGVVRLWGTVRSAKARKEAERIAALTSGASRVENKIVVVKGS